MTIDRSQITAVVLCGGEARRMGGVVKPLLMLGGRPSLSRLLERLAPQVARVLISANGEGFGEFGEVVFDVRRDVGPLAGIEAALAHCTTPFLFVCPGDAPDLPLDVVAQLGNAIGDADVAMAHDGERPQHLHLLLRATQADELHSWLDTGGRAVKQWLTTRQVATVTFTGRGRSFANLNTPQDVRAWERTADEDPNTR